MNELRSRYNALFQELKLLSQCYSGFPKLWDTYLQTAQAHYLILLLDGRGSESAPSPIFNGVEWLRVSDLQSPIALFIDEDGYVNSIKVLDSLTIYLSGLEDYQAAYLEATTSTITLTLKNHPSEPCQLAIAVPVYTKNNELSHYLLPNGAGNWTRATATDIGAI